MKFQALPIVAAMLLCSCAAHEMNTPIAHYDPDAGYRFDNLQAPGQADKLFVVLTFSGGGIRAAALSYGVLEKMKETKFRWNGGERSLLDEVDLISSVSGGSFTAAYYALFGDETFQDFEERFLYRNIEGELKRKLFSPATWLRLASPRYSRTDMAADFYNREIFREKRFADLVAAGRRPFVMLNATDMSMGSIFTFTQEKFDPICSDLAFTTVGRAVAASSCFPVAFAPLTFSNYAGSCEFETPQWVEMASKDLQLNPSRFRRAQEVLSYLDADQRPYIHLLDGGVADNIGLRGPLAGVQSNDPAWSILNRIGLEEIDKLVFIVVDAKSKPEVKFDKKPSPPGLVDVLTKISTIPMDNYSFDTVQALRDEFEEWQKETLYYQGCEQVLIDSDCRKKQMPTDPPHPVDLYLVYVGFDQILDPSERSYFQKMATSFYLPKDQVDDLRRIGLRLMEQSENFKRLVRDLGAVEN
jgi:predicted acylesterase/phospholipase RssA